MLTALAGGSRNRQPSETADERKADYLYLEALRCKALGKPDATFELLQRAYELKPSDVEIGAELASFVLSLSRGDSAEVDRGIRMWRDYVNFNPDDYISGVHYALLNERVGNRTEALGMWNRLHNRFPEKEELTFKYADVLGSTSDTASIRRAVEIYDSLEAVDGKSIALSSKKIQLFYQEADTPAIFSELKSLLASSPSSVEFNVFAGDIFTMFQNRDSALIFYNRACATDSTSGLAFYSRANYYNAIGDSAGYDREIFNALKKESLDVTTKLAMMKGYIEEMYSDSTEQPRIRELFEVLIDQHPHEHDIHDMFSRYLIVTRDYAGAAEQSELALDIEPDDKEGWQMLVSLYLQVQDYENAGKAAQRALRYFPSDPELHLMLGSIYAQLDKPADSRKEYEEALKLGDSSDVEFLSFDGQSYQRPFLVPSLQSCRSGVYMQQVERLVILYFKYMRVSADEELRGRGIYLSAYARVVVARVSADMLHQHLCVLTFPAQLFGIKQVYHGVVAVAMDSPERPELRKPFGHFQRADVSCVPYLVARLEIFKIFVVPICVGVAYYSDFLHGFLWFFYSGYSIYSIL